MKELVLCAALVAGACLTLQDVTLAHGGTYRGPGDTVPPGGGGGGGGGPSTPGSGGGSGSGPTGPTTPGGTTPGPVGGSQAGTHTPRTPGASASGADLTAWSFWWGFNKDPYLNLKASIHSTGVITLSDEYFLGQGTMIQAKNSMRPSEEQIRNKVVPALLEVLEKERNNDIITGALIALAKIGDAKSESGESQFERVIREFLDDPNQEISETAAVALGILANPASIPLLKDLLADSPMGQRAVGKTEVPWRTRAFSAYGLGLIGNRTSDNGTRREIAKFLMDILIEAGMSTRDVEVAALIALGLVPIDVINGAAPERAEGETVDPTHSRQTQIDFLLGFFEDDDKHYLVRAHAPRALARLLQGAPPEQRAAVVEALARGAGKHTKEKQQVRQSCTLALGQIGDTDNDPLDQRIREELERISEKGQSQERFFSLMALAQIGGRPGEGEDNAAGVKWIGTLLAKKLSTGKSRMRPWAGLALGVFGRAQLDAGLIPSADHGRALLQALDDCGAPQDIGAYAIGAGIRREVEARDVLLEKLDKFSDDTARGDIAIALGLMGAREAIEPIQRIVANSKYRPELLKQAAIALGLLGDQRLVLELVEMLGSAKAMASQAAISSALGFIGDSRSIDPLVALLESKDITDRARGFAAVALGTVADKEPLPWNSKLSVDINYRANTTTLTSASEGTGILDIL